VNNSKQLKYLEQYHNILVEIMFLVPKQAEYDAEAAKYFLLIEEILISLRFAEYYKNSSTGLVFIESFIT
jgi:hypothetical protein